MNIENVVIARKLSYVEFIMRSRGTTVNETIDKLQKDGTNSEKILASHYRQLESFRTVQSELEKSFPSVTIFEGDNLSRRAISKSDLVITLGGDDYLKLVSHYVKDGLILSINSDPVTSHGGMIDFNVATFLDFLPRLMTGDFNINEWTRLSVIINGQRSNVMAMSEVFIGARDRLAASRNIIELAGCSEEINGSGILIYTGAGSTGWARAERSCKHELAEAFSRVSPSAQFYVTSIFPPEMAETHSLKEGILNPGQQIKFTYSGHYRGVVSIDPRAYQYNLERGGRVSVEISDKPLKVVVP